MRSLSVAVLLGLSACYAAHPRGEPGDASVDALRARLDARSGDAPFVAADAPFAAACAAHPIDVACTDTGNGAVPVGRPYELPVLFGDGNGCFCGEELRCVATLGEDGARRLETALCSEVLCDGCFPFVQGRCALPPLAEGRHRVQVNGVTSFELEVSDATPIAGPVDACTRLPVDALSCGYEYAPIRLALDEVCHEASAHAGQPIPLEVRSFCMPCGSFWGPCVVTRTASEIVVAGQRQQSLCDVDCPEDCVDSAVTCEIPPLPVGEYTVVTEGLTEPTHLVVTDGPLRPGRACASRPED